jgi:beta-lactamase class A
MRAMIGRRVAAALVLALAAACGSKATPPAEPAPAPAPTAADTRPADPPARPEPPLPAGVPDTKVGHQLAWIVDVVNTRGGEVAADEVTARFNAEFLASVPADQLVATMKGLAAQLGALTLTSVTAPLDGALIAKVDTKAGKLVIKIGLDAAGQIAGLLFTPDAGDRAKTWPDAEAAIGKLAPRTSVSIASIDKGKCTPLKSINPKAQLAIGSTSKLYVLLAVVDQILAGKLSWDTELAVRDDWKSLPSGITQDDAAGTKLTVRVLAERMLSISDNTATDLLLRTVGRAKVEAAVKATKHAKPALNVPFLTTRDLFVLKLELPPADVDAYLALSPAKRRAMLDGKILQTTPTIDMAEIEAWTTARHIDTLEWFASADDLCKVMATLAERAKKPAAAPLLDVLGKGEVKASLDDKTWPYIGFKGGSEPGVMNLTFLLRRDDDKWFFVTMGLNGPTAIDELAAATAGFSLVDLAGQEAR